MQKKKVGLYGGAFDPVHNMHIEIAEKAVDQLELDEIWFLADKNPRKKQQVTAYKYRLEMLRLATKHNKKLITDVLSVQKTGATHGIATLRQFLKDFPDHEFTIICGLDSILYLEMWENYEEFINNTTFAVIKRPEYNLSDFDNLINKVSQQSLVIKYNFIKITPNVLSSSLLRQNIDKLNQYTHPDVAEYIRLNRLY